MTDTFDNFLSSPFKNDCSKPKFNKYAEMKETNTEKYLQSIILSRIHQVAKENIEEIIGGTLTQLKNHIESQFTEGQSWKNHGSEWHIDHIIPLKYRETKLKKPDFTEQMKRFHYKNHQPLGRLENISKGNRYIGAYTKISKSGRIALRKNRRDIVVMNILDIQKANCIDLTYIAAADTICIDDPTIINAVAEAPELTAEEIEGLSRGVSPKDRAAIAKYYLRRCYNYNGVITPAIARIYGDKSLKMQYHARRNLREVHDEVFARPDDAVKILGKRFCDVMIRDLARADGGEVDNLRRLFDFNRDSICVKILSILGLRIGDTKVLTRNELIRLLDTNGPGYKWLSANCKLICTTFGTKITNLPSTIDVNYLKKMLEFINGKLKSRYGISIKLTNKNSIEYAIDDPIAKIFTNTLEIPESTK